MREETGQLVFAESFDDRAEVVLLTRELLFAALADLLGEREQRSERCRAVCLEPFDQLHDDSVSFEDFFRELDTL